jgi:hypothetical protein
MPALQRMLTLLSPTGIALRGDERPIATALASCLNGSD